MTFNNIVTLAADAQRKWNLIQIGGPIRIGDLHKEKGRKDGARAWRIGCVEATFAGCRAKLGPIADLSRLNLARLGSKPALLWQPCRQSRLKHRRAAASEKTCPSM